MEHLWSSLWAGKPGTTSENVLVRMRKEAGRGVGEHGVAVSNLQPSIRDCPRNFEV